MDSIHYSSGIGISLIVLFYIYLQVMNTSIYAFDVPWSNIIICIAVVYIVIFMGIKHANKKIQGKNIIDEIKEENI